LKNLNTLYPGDKKGIHKMRERFIELEKEHEKGLPSSRYYFVWLESKIENRRVSDIKERKVSN
jgi:hypothetical protein